MIGKKISRILHTKWHKGDDILEGIGTPFYTDTYLELEGKEYVEFNHDLIQPVDKVKERLFEYKEKEVQGYGNIKFPAKIIDIEKDEYNEIFIHIEGKIELSINNSYGYHLHVLET
jgi:hypothetical protein